MTLHCRGCGYPNPAGQVCTKCWGRIPVRLRREITDAPEADQSDLLIAALTITAPPTKGCP